MVDNNEIDAVLQVINSENYKTLEDVITRIVSDNISKHVISFKSLPENKLLYTKDTLEYIRYIADNLTYKN